MLRSVRLRLIASFLAAWLIFALTISAVVWLFVVDVTRNIVYADVNLASLRITRLAFQYALTGSPPTDVEALTLAQVRGLHVRINVVPREGFGNGPFVLPPTGPPAGGSSIGIGPHAQIQTVPFGTMRVDIVPDLDYIATTETRWLIGAIIVDLVTLIPAWFLAEIVASRTLEPLLHTTRALERFASGDFTPHAVTTRQRTEIGDLARAYNAAVEQITDAFSERSAAMDEMRQFVADAGHQLRTPLTVLMGHVSALVPKTPREETIFTNMLAQSRRMKAIIDDLIVLARLEHGERTVSTVDIGELADGVVTTFRDGGYERVALHANGPAPARVNPSEVIDALTALIENAIKYAPSGPVNVTVQGNGSRATLIVEDSGPGMSAADIEHAFDRFYRGDASVGTDGTGLGLSIVRRGVERSDGTVTLISTGRGLRVELAFFDVAPPG
ncbi:MAG TPA: HAMP domain-containing sensor histidine kinase [Candidatus Acidoferrum sp.]|jgi:two-component system OmpR family sensor kinase|nr:HAMP domain-containing sensor histidine kinase [Candidatus Acidoferrum sp.]